MATADFSPIQRPGSDSGPMKDLQHRQDVSIRPEGYQSWAQRLLRDPRTRRPLAIAVGPLFVLCFIWFFFAFTFARPRAISDQLAFSVRAHPQSATMVVAILATVLASWTSFFFSLAVRYAIDIRLAICPIPLGELTCATKIAQKSLWFHDPRVGWTWVVLLSYVGVSLQTSALTSFLTLRQIRVERDLVGSDVDLSALSLQQAIEIPGFVAFTSWVPTVLQGVPIHAVNVKRGVRDIFSFRGYMFSSGTTAGIEPASFLPMREKAFSYDGSDIVPPRLQGISDIRTPLLFNKTMKLVQQGFTADVNCRINDTQDLARYQSELNVQSTGVGLSSVSLNVTCPGPGLQMVDEELKAANGLLGALIGVSCPIPDTTAYDIIIRGTGKYAVFDITVCTISPKITAVNVTYYNAAPGFEVPTTIDVSQVIQEASAPIFGQLAVRSLRSFFFYRSYIPGSTMGEIWSLVPRDQNNTTLPEIMGDTIKAALEFIGTVIRQSITAIDSDYIQGGWDSLSSSMRTPIRGTLFVTTYGWLQDGVISPLFLLPTTTIVLVTYALLGYAITLARVHADDFQKEDADFDPTDIVHVIAAHWPETRREGFATFSDPVAQYTRRTRVNLITREGRRILNVITKRGAASVEE